MEKKKASEHRNISTFNYKFFTLTDKGYTYTSIHILP